MLAIALLTGFVTTSHAEEITIAALGDSLTQGYGLLPEDGFVPQLERELRARGHDVRLVNAGVSGDTTAGGLARIDWTLTPEIGGLIVALGGNDLLRGIDPDASRANLEGILRTAQDAEVEVLLVGLQAPGNYGPEYQEAFNRIYPELAAQYGTHFADSFFLGYQNLDREEQQALTQPDGLHPNANGVRAIVAGLVPLVEDLVERVADRSSN